MQFQFNVAPPGADGTPSPPNPQDPTDLLKQILEVQREQLQLMRTLVTLQDGGARWRAFLSRWKDQYPATPSVCRKSSALLERAYIEMIADLGERLEEEGGEDALENEFVLNEFLDRYGIRLAQIGNLINLITPLADADK